MANTGEQGGQGAHNTPPNPDQEQLTHSSKRPLTGAAALPGALNTLDEALVVPITVENQEDWKTRVTGLRAQVMSIRREINTEKEHMTDRENRLAQEARRLQQESEVIEAQKLSLARPERHASRIPTDL